LKTRTAQDIWDTALGELQLQVSKANFKTWLAKTRALTYNNNTLVLGVPNTFVSEYLDKNLRSLIEKTLIGITQHEVKVEFSVEGTKNNLSSVEEHKEHQTVTSVPAVREPPAFNAFLNSRYTFDNFVVSQSNRLAFAAANGVVESPGKSMYNPLYIYGGVGLGKTHLLSAIGNASIKRGMRIVYVSAEQFTTDFINAVRERKTDEFRSKYRNLDMLLIDDIQFLGGKEQTEESFFHIFNELKDSDRQIALTSNCPPHSIPLIEERLRSRLEWGLCAGIQPPDFETRMEILSKKASKEGVDIAPDVLEFIAERIKQNIRELEGSLNRVVAYAKLLRAVVTPELASEALEDIATKKPKGAASPMSLLEVIAEYFNIDLDDLKGSKRDKQVALARQIAMYLLREQTDYSLSRIGREVGGRQPILVSKAHKKISEELKLNTGLRQNLNDIEHLLSGQ